MKSIKKTYRIDRREIYFVKFIFEAYDGIALMSTVDNQAGIVDFLIAPGCENDADWLLNELKKDIMIEAITD